MGWSFGYDNRCATDVHREVLSPSFFGEGTKILDHASTAYGKHLWAAVDNAKGERFIVLFLIAQNDGCWGYKAITEDMGPCYYDCPDRLLKLVPVANEAWRKKIQEQKVAKTRKFAVNDVVTVYGKRYTIVGPHKRSYLIRSVEDGKVYKASAAKMEPT